LSPIRGFVVSEEKIVHHWSTCHELAELLLDFKDSTSSSEGNKTVIMAGTNGAVTTAPGTSTCITGDNETDLPRIKK